MTTVPPQMGPPGQQPMASWPPMPVVPDQSAGMPTPPIGIPVQSPPAGFPMQPQPYGMPPQAGWRRAPSRLVKTASVELIIVGILGTLAGGAFLIMSLSGDLEDTLGDAGLELTVELETFTLLMVVQLAFGLLAIASGIGVRGLKRGWQVTAFIVAALGAAGGVVNLITLGNTLTVVFILLYVHVIIGLVQANREFTPAGQYR